MGVLALAATAIIFGDTEQASAQTVDVSGAWTFEVTTDTGVTAPSLTLEQDGETLTGHYSSETLGEADVTGTVEGSTVTISFEADLGSMPISVIYVGTVDAEGVMTGTIDLANGTLTGTFTAKRPDASSALIVTPPGPAPRRVAGAWPRSRPTLLRDVQNLCGTPSCT